jgi:predicted nucleic acid-binding protein
MDHIVSNSSPLISLDKIDQFLLLKMLFHNVIIPDAVWQEVVVQGVGRPGSHITSKLEKSGWIHRKNVKDTFAVKLLQTNIGKGEAEAIVLSRELNANWVLIDDDIARTYALKAGLKVKGTLGILLAGYKAGFIKQLKPLLIKLRNQGFWISDQIYNRILTYEK